jgi:hypothetical protein
VVYYSLQGIKTIKCLVKISPPLPGENVIRI